MEISGGVCLVIGIWGERNNVVFRRIERVLGCLDPCGIHVSL